MKQAFLEECSKNLHNTLWGGINGSGLAHTLIQGLQTNPHLGPFWIICTNEAECEKLIADLQFFASFCSAQTNIGHYAEDDPRTFDGASPAPQCPRKRIYAHSLLSKKNTIIVSSVLGILHKTLSADDIAEQTLHLTEGTEYKKKEILEKLYAIGYRVENPSEEGTYLFRGDTLLIWPNGASNPYRICFFDDEVESIHILSTKSHSKISSTTEISILPCKEAIITPHSLQRLRRAFQQQLLSGTQQKEEISRILQDLEQGFWFPGAEDYLPLLWNLVSATIQAQHLFFLHPSEITQKMTYWDLQVANRWMHIEESERPSIDPLMRFSKSTEFMERQYIQVQELDGDGLFFGVVRPHNISLHKIEESKAQLTQWLDEEWEIILSTPSLHQFQKIKNILRGISFQEIQEGQSTPTHSIRVVFGTLMEGYVDAIRQRVFLCSNDLLPTPISQKTKTLRQATLQSYTDLNIGDYVVHKTHGVGRFLKLVSMNIKGHPIECVEVEYQGEATLLVPLNRLDQLYKYRSVGNKEPKIDKLGGKSWQTKITKVKTQVLELAHQLIRIHAKRSASTGYAYDIQNPLISQFSSHFPYEETPDQENAIADILSDLSKEKHMDRLLIGDVGFGKTEVAMRAAMCVAANGHQVAMLCPTTILSMQHYNTLKQRFAPFNINIALVSRLQTATETKEIYQKLARGEIHILIGTHAILNKRILFHKLGLVIADEEHRFGVVQKEKLRALSQENGIPVKYLAMSATPIPRSLHMAFSGIRDVSIIATPPIGRLSVETLTIHESDAKIQQQIRRELQRGGQVFFVHNRVESLPSRVDYLTKLVPEARICFAHGQQRADVLEQTMIAFMQNKYNLLVCTSIIENGVDLPNANTIIIDQAQQLGLAQLYQLRGRVGRSTSKAYCTFIIPKQGIKRNALARLHTLQHHTDLASGFAVASADLELRGSGNLLGKEQSGHIQTVGLDIYIDLLEQSVLDIQGKNSLDLLDPEVEIPVSGSLPEAYMPDTHERLREYQKLSFAHSHAELRIIAEDWIATYGELPEQATQLIWSIECEIWCRSLGIQKLHWLKSRVLIMLHKFHDLNIEKLERLCSKHVTRIKKTSTPSGIEISAYFTPEEAEAPFGFLFWVFQELRMCLNKPMQ